MKKLHIVFGLILSAFAVPSFAWTTADISTAFADGATAVTAAQTGWLLLLGLMVGATLISKLFSK